MPRSIAIACVQVAAATDRRANLARLDELIDEAAVRRARLIGLPEYATCYGVLDGRFELGAQPEDAHAALTHLADAARRTSTWPLVISTRSPARAG